MKKIKNTNIKVEIEIVKNDDPKLDRLYQALLAVISENDILELLKNEKSDCSREIKQP